MKDGCILIDKPKGITSFVAVAVVRRALGVKHCGHTGTLDPIAEGLLPVLTGKATKLSAYLLEGDKRYTAQLSFGFETDTLDSTGTVLYSGGSIPTEAQLRQILDRFTGKQLQVPPMFSAIKKDGVPLYKLARKGETRAVDAREIEIYSLDLLQYENGKASLDIRCSKGTYIRSLCRDIGHALGTYGCMTALRRTETCGFSVREAIPLDKAEAFLKEGQTDCLRMMDTLLPFPRFTPPEFFAKLLANGCAVEIKKLKNCPETSAYVYTADTLIGIGKPLDDGTFKIVTHL